MGNRSTRVVFAGGGTGGHLYPALAVAKELRRRWPGASIRFVGARRGLERRLVPEAGYPLQTLSLAGIKGASLPAKAIAVFGAFVATLQCAARMVRERPDLVIGVGGYASGPAVAAAWMLRVKTMVMEQNHFPGATNRWLAPRVDAVCLPSEAARQHLRGNTFITGNPVRGEFFSIPELTEPGDLSVLIVGGSRGARSINRAVTGALARLGASAGSPRIVHQTGTTDLPWVERAYESYGEDRREVRPFFDDMPARFRAARLVVCRAGASTIAELCAAGRPAILIPYPYAADDHQLRNAETLERVGAAEIVADAELDGDRLAGRIADLLADPQRLCAMGRAARTLSRPDAAASIVDVARRLVPEHGEAQR